MAMISIDQSIQLIVFLLYLIVLLSIYIGLRHIVSAKDISYSLLRREHRAKGWRWMLFGFATVSMGLVVQIFGSRAVHIFIPNTPTNTSIPTTTLTPSITSTPIITFTPIVTSTPSDTPTLTETSTPVLPPELGLLLIREAVTPSVKAVFSPIMVAAHLDINNRPINPSDIFKNPITKLYGAFTYDYLQDGIRWTAIWSLENEIVCLDTQVWGGGTGGSGFTDCQPDQWLAGNYEIQMFVGEQWKVSTRFIVVGEPPTPTSTPSLIPSAISSPTA